MRSLSPGLAGISGAGGMVLSPAGLGFSGSCPPPFLALLFEHLLLGFVQKHVEHIVGLRFLQVVFCVHELGLLGCFYFAEDPGSRRHIR